MSAFWLIMVYMCGMAALVSELALFIKAMFKRDTYGIAVNGFILTWLLLAMFWR